FNDRGFTCARSDWNAARHQIGIAARDHRNPQPAIVCYDDAALHGSSLLFSSITVHTSDARGQAERKLSRI
ncbi:hypothetical protein, partial [Bradyrhizobium oropedii]|uniref:hypothetical protein n=1 Tax=Bradyrhizobium oropedii TaxID=1571201 RepID=UPI001E596F8B